MKAKDYVLKYKKNIDSEFLEMVNEGLQRLMKTSRGEEHGGSSGEKINTPPGGAIYVF
jgi:hypothetical protein